MHLPSKIELVPVDSIRGYDRNPRTHSDEQVDQIAASMKRFGWTQPILCDENSQIVAGHGRLMAAHKLGLKKVPVIRRSDWTEEEKRAYVIADNQLALNAGWDMETLTSEILALSDADFDMSVLGFDETQLSDFLGLGSESTDQSDGLQSSWAIILDCEGEAHQVELLEEFESRGLKCRALI